MTVQRRPSYARWIPRIFVLGFAVIFAVNAVLVFVALDSFSGLVVSQPYRKGMEYTGTRQAIEAQAKLGWRCAVAAEPRGPNRVDLSVRCAGADHAPLTDLSVAGELHRPVERLAAIPVVFEHRGAGRYSALIDLPKAGAWDLQVQAWRGSQRLATAERVIVP